MASIINASNSGFGGIVSTGDSSGQLQLQAAGTTVATIQSTGLNLGSNGVVFSDSSSQTAAASPYVLKNRIINGDMRIDQRNAGASVTPTTLTYTIDRWSAAEQTDGSMTVQQSSVVPAGFTNSLLTTVTSADSSLGSTQYAVLRQAIEGFNVADFGWGSANAQTVTLSFWVRSSVTGTFGGSLQNSAQDRSYPFSYTISAANTWEKESITIAGDTTGTWLTTNGTGINLWLGLGIGSTYSGTAGAWAAGLFFAPTGAVNLLATNGATFYITGVQLEIGTSATPFERRLYNQELANCQRYVFIINGKSAFSDSYSRYLTTGNSTTGTLWMPTFPVQMRTPPSLLTKNFTGSYVDFYNYNTTGVPTFSSVAISEGDVVHAQVTIIFTSGSAVGNMISWRWIANPDAYIGFNAEL